MFETYENLLEVRGLKTYFFTSVGVVKAVDDISFSLRPGEAIALVGESGCGKSVTALSIMRLVPTPGRIVEGSVFLAGQDLLEKSEQEMTTYRGRKMAMVFQDPMTSLNPVLTVGTQIREVIERHQGLKGSLALTRVEEMLRLVGIPNPERRLRQYPHEFSGGMRQRVMIAMALACDPELLILDEPTTALDVTIQAQILDLIRRLKQKLDTSVILITHDLGVVAGLTERVIVMYAGKIVESGTVNDIFENPKHPYTWGLLNSVPRLDTMSKKRLVPIHGQPPDLLKPPVGCPFHPRCKYVMRVCIEDSPPQFEVGSGHITSCWLLDKRAPQVRRAAFSG